MIDLDPRQTAIIPIKKEGDTYILKVDKSLWNEIQILILEGGSKKRMTIEFKYEEETTV